MTSPTLPVACYGKLPAFGDFIRYNTNGQGMQILDQWIQKGLYLAKNYLGREWDTIYSPEKAFFFIYPFAEQNQYYAGIFRPSKDRGNRKYPFLIFATIDLRNLLGQQRFYLPLMLKPFFDGISEKMPMIIYESDMKQAIERVEELSTFQLSTLAAREYDHYLHKTTIGQFWHKHLGAVEEDKKYLIFKNLLEIVLPLRGRQDLSRYPLGLRFPFRTPDDNYVSDVCVWQSMVMHVLSISGASDKFLPALFWPVDPAGGYFHLFFTRPDAKTFVGLLHPSWDSEQICRMETFRRLTPQEAKRSLPNQYRELLEHRQHNLHYFLTKLRY